MISPCLYMKGRGAFIDCPRVPKLWFNHFISRVKLHGRWGPRLEMSIHNGWIRLSDCSSWFLGAGVAGAQDGSWGCQRFIVLYLDAKPPHMGADVDRSIYRL
jgi:hypothetical protein